MSSEIRTRHAHPLLMLTVIVCFAVVLATQGLVVRKASDAAQDAREGVDLIIDVTDPSCDRERPACKRAVEQRAGQGKLVSDIEEVSVVGSFCAHQHIELDAVRSCVEREFRERTGRSPANARTTTTRPGGNP